MTIPGMTTCKEVAPCGAGTWGDIPVAPTTQYVDRAYAGGKSDGSAQRPWTSIQAGVDAAAKDAIVAVAAGAYPEYVAVNRPVRIWGRCPALVDVTGTITNPTSISIWGTSAGGAELHTIGVSGRAVGLEIEHTAGVTLDRLWIHDTHSRGMALRGAGTVARMMDSLVEITLDTGVLASGAKLTILRSNLRDADRGALADGGRGVVAETDPSGVRAVLTILTSLIERNHRAGVFVVDAIGQIDGTVVRDTRPNPQGSEGYGIAAIEAGGGGGASLVLRRSVVATSGAVGVLVAGASAAIETTVVRDIRPQSPGDLGRGIEIERGAHARAGATIRKSVVRRASEAGVCVLGSDAAIESTLIRDTRPDAKIPRGDGIAALVEEDPAKVTIAASLVSGSQRAGVAIFGSDVSMGDLALACNGVDIAGQADQGTPFSLAESGEILCGCGTAKGACATTSPILEPEKPVHPVVQ